MWFGKMVVLSVMSSLLFMSSAFGAGQQMMRSRVPADKLDEARALTSPLPDSPDIIEKGKAIYEGKGTCVNCHGVSGRGDGAGAANLNPPPRVFKSRGFWKHRTEGEVFWVIKHGSSGTAMIPFGGLLSDEEIWTVMQYERSFAGGHGKRKGHRGMQGSMGMGKHKMSGGHAQGDEKGHHENGEGGCGSKMGHQYGGGKKDPQQIAEKAGSAAIQIDQAIKLATEAVPGTPIEAEFEIEEAQAFWEVEVVNSDGKVMEVHVDSESGAILATEEKKDEKKQKRERKRKGKKGGHEGCSKMGQKDHDRQHDGR